MFGNLQRESPVPAFAEETDGGRIFPVGPEMMNRAEDGGGAPPDPAISARGLTRFISCNEVMAQKRKRN